MYLADRLGVGQAVGQHLLPEADRLRVVQAGEQDLRGYLVQELVAVGHRLQQRAQFQVLAQVLVSRWQPGRPVEAPVPVEEVGLHAPSPRSPANQGSIAPSLSR